MVRNRYAQAELREENWSKRLARVTNETRDLIARTRSLIKASRDAMAAADKRLDAPAAHGERLIFLTLPPTLSH